MANSFGCRGTFRVGDRDYTLYRFAPLFAKFPEAARLPFSLKILLENLLRKEDDAVVRAEDIAALCKWDATKPSTREIAFMPARVLLQDFTGVPCVVDLAALRDALVGFGGDPKRVNPHIPVELVIDHSVQVDSFGSELSFHTNAAREFERNRERYEFLRWGQGAFKNFRVVPPDTGIVHQVNLEYLARVVFLDGDGTAYPDTVIGTDSHTTMINGLGVLGWGVGGIEAEAAMLGQSVSMLIPEVVGFKLTGHLPEGATATDLVLMVTQLLRAKGVVGKFVEFHGPGLADLGLEDRATIANMAPEYGATCGIFPVDDVTLRFLRFTGRPAEMVALVEAYCKEQGLFHTADTPPAVYSDVLELDLSKVEPSLAGPSRPQDRVRLGEVRKTFATALPDLLAKAKPKPGQVVPPPNLQATATVQVGGTTADLKHGSVVIAAITSCTNTSNPSVMIAAGLVARKAVAKGLKTKPWVKTSLAPGSKVVTDYFDDSGLSKDLDALGFQLVGYGCTTCVAEGTPVLLANGTSRRIEQLPSAGGTLLFSPDQSGILTPTLLAEAMPQGRRDCVRLVLQDGRELVCTPDHEILCRDGRWVRADALDVGEDRVVVGLEAPLDAPGDDEAGYRLTAGSLTFSTATPHERLRLLAFARLAGHQVGEGAVLAVVDREVVLNDVEVVTGERPVATASPDGTWTIVYPAALVDALPGRDAVPEFLLDRACPVAVIREFLGGFSGARGLAPGLYETSDGKTPQLGDPAFALVARPDRLEAGDKLLRDVLHLLGRCGVETDGATFTRLPVAKREVRLVLRLADGLSFVERVGYRYHAEKALQASAAVVFWRTRCLTRELVPAGSASDGFLSDLDPSAVFEDIGFMDARDPSRTEEAAVGTFALRVVDRQPAGKREVFDLSVEQVHSFVAGTVAVSNCIGNSGPLPEAVSKGIEQGGLVVASVLSGNRNFEGRVHSEVRANFLASPPLVVAYALAGTVEIDLTTEPIGTGSDGQPVYLKDIWPTQDEVRAVLEKSVRAEMFTRTYECVYTGDKNWQDMDVPTGDRYDWDEASTYVKHPPYFVGMGREPEPVRDISGARVLAVLGNSITTDHVSPAGAIKANGPAGQYLVGRGVAPRDFNSYGARRGHDEVMVRGTFANVRLKNLLAPGTEGGVTRYLPTGEVMSIFEASERYKKDGVPLVILAGKEYGSGSSRDWAAKGPMLLGVKVVIADSYERIHRSNLVGMGILPLQFLPGENATTLELTGEEVFDFVGLPAMIKFIHLADKDLEVHAKKPDGSVKTFRARVRIDTPQEVKYYQHGGILPYVLRQLLTT